MTDMNNQTLVFEVESSYFEAIRIKKDFELSEIRIIKMYREREIKKMCLTDQKCRTSVQGGGGAPNPFLTCSLIADSCL